MEFSVVTLAAAEHVVNKLPFPPFMFGVIAMVAFIALAFVTWTFRNVAEKNPMHSRVIGESAVAMNPDGQGGHHSAHGTPAADGAHRSLGHGKH